jgi:predicted regulator of Ras-like GTPase activity (Roadblock/LC7/MglB family)
MPALLSAEAQNFNWLVDNFVDTAVGVTDAVAVSSDGLLMAMSRGLGRDDAEHVSAIVTGFVSLGLSTSSCFGFEGLNQVIVAMKGGYLFVSSISDGSALGVVATAGCDIGLVGYQTTLLVERAGSVLTPELISELRGSVLT